MLHPLGHTRMKHERKRMNARRHQHRSSQKTHVTRKKKKRDSLQLGPSEGSVYDRLVSCYLDNSHLSIFLSWQTSEFRSFSVAGEGGRKGGLLVQRERVMAVDCRGPPPGE
jgi:hypothetical protein